MPSQRSHAYAQHKLLRRTFRTGIALKGLDGLLESIAGVLLVAAPGLLNRVGLTLWASELLRNPSRFSNHLAQASERLAHVSPHFAAAYLLSHGLVKIVLVVALWRDKLWAYPLAIFVFAAFVFYQLFRFTHTHSIGLVLLTIFDIAIICLTWTEYVDQKRMRERA
jgi:uncharacterized membrane protein